MVNFKTGVHNASMPPSCHVAGCNTFVGHALMHWSHLMHFLRKSLSSADPGGRISEPCYQAVHARHGTVGIVELTALVGYYTMVAMMLNAHDVRLPDSVTGAGAPLPAVGTGEGFTVCGPASA